MVTARYGGSVVLVTLTDILLSFIVDIEWEISRLAVSVDFSKVLQYLLCSIWKNGRQRP